MTARSVVWCNSLECPIEVDSCIGVGESWPEKTFFFPHKAQETIVFFHELMLYENSTVIFE